MKNPICFDLNIAIVYSEINVSVKTVAKIYERLNFICSLKDNNRV